MLALKDVKILLVESAMAHCMQFKRPLAPDYSAVTGQRVLGAFLVVGIGVFLLTRFLLRKSRYAGMPEANFIFVMLLLFGFFIAHKQLIQRNLSSFGLRPIAQWTSRECLYFYQVVPLALVIFALLFKEHLLALWHLHGAATFVLFTVITGVLWGIVQELLYRAWLQTELTRRYGTFIGLLGANVLFTFGPLHFNLMAHHAGPHWVGLLAVFAIGLVFGLMYQRSGNVWLPAILHGLWPLNMS